MENLSGRMENLSGPLSNASFLDLSKIRVLVKVIVKVKPGLEVIKLEYSLTLKIKRNDWLLADTCPFSLFWV